MSADAERRRLLNELKKQREHQKCGKELGPDGLRRQVYPAEGRLSQEQIDNYNSEGYLILEGALKPRELQQLRDEVWGCWCGSKGGAYDPDSTWLSNALLPDIHHKSRFAFSYNLSLSQKNKLHHIII